MADSNTANGKLGIFSKIKLGLLNPGQLFDRVRDESLKDTYIYYLIIWFVFGLLIPGIIGYILFGNLINAFYSIMPGVFNSIVSFYLAIVIIAGLLSVFLVAGIIHIGVRVLGGKGGYVATFKAFVYAATPNFVLSFLLVLIAYSVLGTIFGSFILTGDITKIGQGMLERSFANALAGMLVLAIVSLLIFIWNLILTIKGLSKLHGFSGLRSFGAIVIGWLILFVLVFVLTSAIAFVALESLMPTQNIPGQLDDLEKTLGVAFDEENPEVCERMTDVSRKDLCFSLVAVNIKDSSLCERMSTERGKDSCYIGTAYALQDPAVCENIIDPITKDNCIFSLSGLP